MSPRSKQQFLALREKSIVRIVEAATELFARQGFHGTSITAIAQAAKVSKGLMYNYFEGKERLLDAILDKAFMEINGHMVMLLEEKDPFDRLNAIVEATFSMVKNKLSVFGKSYPLEEMKNEILNQYEMYRTA